MKKLLVLIFTGVVCTLSSFGLFAHETEIKPLEISSENFSCMLDMTAVRGFYVDNLNKDNLDKTLAIANAEQGVYPVGSIVQLVPTEVMVKRQQGFSPVTNDWEFFELNVSAKGTEIYKRGFVDVVNRFGGNCFACHVKAKPEYDFVCEQGHGCDPIPLTAQMTPLLQKTDPRCQPAYVPTVEEKAVLKQLFDSLSNKPN